MTDYYSKKQFLFAVDKNDHVIGRVEKQEAHKKGLLHRGFTVILFHNDRVVLQHRKHPVFDRVFDMSFSSHQIYGPGQFKDDLTSVYKSLKREWFVDKNSLTGPPRFLGKVYYRAKDKKTGYVEHEFDYIYLIELKKLPKANLEFAYGYKLIKKNLSSVLNPPLSNLIAPWVKKIVDEHFMTDLRSK